jgi:predicted nucleic acid-binding protein
VIVVLDSEPVGILANHTRPTHMLACRRWMYGLLNRRVTVCLSEVSDFEVTRELIRRNSSQGLMLLDRLATTVEYVEITTPVMRRAAMLWAEARNRGIPTADKMSLDADVILAAQAQLLREATGDRVVVVTSNIRHLAQFVEARPWQEINE